MKRKRAAVLLAEQIELALVLGRRAEHDKLRRRRNRRHLLRRRQTNDERCRRRRCVNETRRVISNG